MAGSFGDRARQGGLSGLEMLEEREAVDREVRMLSDDLAHDGEILSQSHIRHRWGDKASNLQTCEALLNRIAAHAKELAVWATILAAHPDTPNAEPLSVIGSSRRRPADLIRAVHLAPRP